MIEDRVEMTKEPAEVTDERDALIERHDQPPRFVDEGMKASDDRIDVIDEVTEERAAMTERKVNRTAGRDDTSAIGHYTRLP